MNTLIAVDIETDGPCAGMHSMLSLAASTIPRDEESPFVFSIEIAPMYNHLWTPEAMEVNKLDRNWLKNHGMPPGEAINDFAVWLKQYGGDEPKMITDNPAFDFAFVNYYFHYFIGHNPLGYSARRIGDIWSGMVMDSQDTKGWLNYVSQLHTHVASEDVLQIVQGIQGLRKMGWAG